MCLFMFNLSVKFCLFQREKKILLIKLIFTAKWFILIVYSSKEQAQDMQEKLASALLIRYVTIKTDIYLNSNLSSNAEP